jgi:aldehyde dehydrogenase (NAD+)
VSGQEKEALKRDTPPTANWYLVTAMNSTDVQTVRAELFSRLQLREEESGVFGGKWSGNGPLLKKRSPIDGSVLGSVRQATAEDYDQTARAAQRSFKKWRLIPAPRRGELIRRLGLKLRELKPFLGRLVSLEAGKIITEGEGEVQEMIDICDFANGLSRQLYGLTIASERPGHRMFEQWQPLGIVGIISAFNFPVAVWSWNAALAVICGNAVVWKPSEKTPLTAIACTKIAAAVCEEAGEDPAIFSLVIGGRETGAWLANDRRIALLSATGSVRMGKEVAQAVARRLGKSLLELGGNNAVIVTPSATLEMAKRALLFGAVGTAGQRCTSTRRLIVHRSVRERLLQSLQTAYRSVKIGNPLEPSTLMGPLIDERAVQSMGEALAQVRAQGGEVRFGGERLSGPEYPGGQYVQPCIVEAENDWPVVQNETFAPILYVLTYDRLEEAIAMQNGVPQGLSSSIFSNDIQETETFLSAIGSDCGLANVNVGTSGAEIGGAFGGEKDTGGGRESGSDAWRNYMRRQTSVINYSSDLPLAQGIRFE